MANETKKTVTDNATAETTDTAVTETAAEMNGIKLFVERKLIKDKFGKPLKNASGGNMYAYEMPCVLQNKNTKIDFTPKDFGGYEPLDFVFNVSEKAELLISETESETNSGKKTRYNSYTVRNVDDNGIVWECNVKPQRDSDKCMLKTWLQILGVTVTIY